uniref:CBM-cenC domain-containing protein n=1 Tax=Streptomyces sp. NBC_01393 TaxID=2903851 RepID=A0AAU3I9J6_9ACTN
MVTRSLAFEKDADFTPVVTVSGSLVIRRYRVVSPLISGSAAVDGALVIRIPRPRPVAPQAGQFTVGGRFGGGIKAPAAAFKDFSHYPVGGTDPAMAWIGANSGTLKSAVAGSYSRPYTAFTGPVDYPVSGSGYAWKRAAYAAVGFKFASMSANKHQVLDAVQLEPLPLGASGPSPYQNAREVQAVIKPTRLNYSQNPNMESGIAGYSVSGPGVMLSDSSNYWRGSKSMQVTVPRGPVADAGAGCVVSGLIPGRRYTVSARVNTAQYCGDVYMQTGLAPAVNQVLNPSAEVDITNVSAYGSGATRTRVTTDSYVGSACVQHVHTTGASQAGSTWATTTMTGTGKTVKMRLMLKVPSTGVSNLQLAFRNGGSTVKIVNLTMPPSGSWQTVEASYTLAAGETVNQVGLSILGALNATWWADAVQADVTTATLPAYGDGSMTGWQWDGTAFASASRTIANSDSASLVKSVSFNKAPADPSLRKWRVVSATFDAASANAVLRLLVNRATMSAGQPSIFWVDGVLIEEGTSVRTYFDGSMGSDYLWEQGGSANLARAYFYQDYTERSYLIRTLLAENVPLGITAAVPQYAVLPTQ